MAGDDMIGRRGGALDLMPDYRHPPAATVDLGFPFVIMGRTVASIDLSPPGFGALADLRRRAAAMTPIDVLAALTGEPGYVLAAMRWPDVERVLAAGTDMLPPDFLAPPPVAEPAAPDWADQTADSGPDTGADVGAQLGGAEPADFVRTI